jgi:hypothetical protein
MVENKSRSCFVMLQYKLKSLDLTVDLKIERKRTQIFEIVNFVCVCVSLMRAY